MQQTDIKKKNKKTKTDKLKTERQKERESTEKRKTDYQTTVIERKTGERINTKMKIDKRQRSGNMMKGKEICQMNQWNR